MNTQCAAATQEAPSEQPPPALQLLGPVQVLNPHGTTPQSKARATELIAFLSLHPWDGPELLDAAMWPGTRVTSDQRCQAMHRARVWLGTTEHGQPYLPLVSQEGYRLLGSVRTDWDTFRALLPNGPRAATTTTLTKALQLIHGQPLSGINPVRYTWSDLDRQQMIAATADAAHELTTRALRHRQSRIANWASAIGTTVEPASEVLWRDRLEAAHLAADPQQLEVITTQLQLALGALGKLEPPTLRLLRTLTG
ncbi:hypothetical protein [Ornithinimicrobium murale]|uniref:hypothetical protein n=1 Tax=Ornithinimicrobium murale TaxID=1050153 RepID=UPI000E0D7CEE|nr:hypothetical protein [Ornithinimicrobium murale]